jgi:carboxylesterase type B
MLQDLDRKLAETMTNYWVNFAKTGDPNGKGLPKWTPYNASDEPYMDFGEVVQLRNHLAQSATRLPRAIQKRR